MDGHVLQLHEDQHAKSQAQEADDQSIGQQLVAGDPLE